MISWHGDSFLALINQRVDQALDESAEAVAEEARRRAPVKSGDLRDSIQVMEDGDDSRAVGSDLPYALEVELGDESTPAANYLRGAVESSVDAITQAFDME